MPESPGTLFVEAAVPQPSVVLAVVEGRTFVNETPSFEQDLYIMEQVTEAGLVQLGVPQLDPEGNLPLAIQRLIIRAYQSGALFKLMGALLTEEGTEWTKESALANAELFRKTRDPESKRSLQPAMIQSVVAFFESAASSELTSLTSSGSPSPAEAAAESGVRVRPKLRPAGLDETQLAEAWRSGTLPTPSAKSRTTTGSIRKRSSAGRSAKA